MIRRGELKDRERIMALERSSMLHPWAEEDITALLKDDNKIALVFEDEGKIEGYVGCSYVLDEAEIGNICVAPQRRREGMAKALLQSLFDMLAGYGILTVFLEVESGNKGAVALYEKTGFERYNERRDYYGEGRNALLFRKEL